MKQQNQPKKTLIVRTGVHAGGYIRPPSTGGSTYCPYGTNPETGLCYTAPKTR